MKYPILHAGVTTDGHIVLTRGDGSMRVVSDGASLEDLKTRASRALSIEGPWLPVPGVEGNPVVGNLPTGEKVRADAAGYAYNDAALVDAICGAGTYERLMPAEEVAILHLARCLYEVTA